MGRSAAEAMPPKSYLKAKYSPKFKEERQARLENIVVSAVQTIGHSDLEECPRVLRGFLGLDEWPAPVKSTKAFQAEASLTPPITPGQSMIFTGSAAHLHAAKDDKMEAADPKAQVSLREKACTALTEASANGRLVQVLESVRGPALAPAAETQLVSIENKLTKSSDGWPTRQAPEDDVAESDEACSNVLRGTTEVCGRKFKVDAAFCEGCGNRRAEEGPASPSRMRSAKIDAPPPSDGQEDVGDQQDKLKAEVAAAKTSSDKFDVYLSKIQEALEQNSDEALVQPEEGKPSACCRAAPALCTAAAVVALAAASASSRRRNGL